MAALLILTLLLAAAVAAALWPRRGLIARWRRARELAQRARVEDALKHIHAREGRGALATPESLAGHLGLSVRGTLALIATMEERGLVQSTGPGLRLSDAGRDLAVRVIRAHRLLERYLADELGMPLEEIHAAADRREHRLTVEEADELDARLGYPRRDPHGDPIPTSAGALETVEATALTDWPAGRPARIVHIEDEPPEVMADLASAGLAPGMQIEIRRFGPDRVAVWDGEREIELAPLAAANVYVAALPHPVRPPLKLSALKPGEAARVLALRCAGFERRRLLDLGLTPGTTVECAFPGPLGEPVAYRVRGATIALRREQADRIEIEPIGGARAEETG